MTKKKTDKDNKPEEETKTKDEPKPEPTPETDITAPDTAGIAEEDTAQPEAQEEAPETDKATSDTADDEKCNPEDYSSVVVGPETSDELVENDETPDDSAPTPYVDVDGAPLKKQGLYLFGEDNTFTRFDLKTLAVLEIDGKPVKVSTYPRYIQGLNVISALLTNPENIAAIDTVIKTSGKLWGMVNDEEEHLLGLLGKAKLINQVIQTISDSGAPEHVMDLIFNAKQVNEMVELVNQPEENEPEDEDGRPATKEEIKKSGFSL